MKKEEVVTFPITNIGIKKAGTAETKAASRYSNSVNVC